MKQPEPRFRVHVDVSNPGQFFACCGLLELAHRLWPGAEGWFENGRFCVASLAPLTYSLEEMLEVLTNRGMHLTPDDPTPCGRRLRRPHPRGAIGQRSWVLQPPLIAPRGGTAAVEFET